MKHRLFLIFTSVSILLFFVSCSGIQFQVDSVEPVEHHLRSQVLDLRNCNSQTDLQKSLATEFQVAMHITISIDETKHELIENRLPENIYSRLEKQIETTYKNIYEDAVSELDQTIVSVPANKVHTININWEEIVYNSKIHLVINEETHTWLYTYSLEIPKLGSAWETGCTA